MDQEFGQMDIAKCIKHPERSSSFIFCKEKCPYTSRLACNKCLMEYKTIEGFVDVLDILKDPRIILFNNDRPQSSYNLLCKYFVLLEKDPEKFINNLQEDILKQIQKLQQDLKDGIEQYNKFREEIKKAKQQFYEALGHEQIKQAFRDIIEVENYHQSEQWAKLEETVQDFVLQFEIQKNQELNATCYKLKQMEENFFKPQVLTDFTNTISKSVEILCRKFQDTIVFPRFTSLCDQAFFVELVHRIQKESNDLPNLKLIFKASEQGMNVQSFWQKCNNQGPTIMICKSKNNHVFGGYTPCKWTQNNYPLQDNTQTSFLFSFTRKEIYPILAQGQNAICGYNQLQFGADTLVIQANFQTGSSNMNNSYYSNEQFKIEDQKTHLMGSSQPDLVEMEVFLIQ